MLTKCNGVKNSGGRACPLRSRCRLFLIPATGPRQQYLADAPFRLTVVDGAETVACEQQKPLEPIDEFTDVRISTPGGNAVNTKPPGNVRSIQQATKPAPAKQALFEIESTEITAPTLQTDTEIRFPFTRMKVGQHFWSSLTADGDVEPPSTELMVKRMTGRIAGIRRKHGKHLQFMASPSRKNPDDPTSEIGVRVWRLADKTKDDGNAE